MSFIRTNCRAIPKEDKIFALNGRAGEMINREGEGKVINATIGTLLDDEGRLMILDSVQQVYKELKGEDFAPYAPIGGLPGFKESVKKALFKGRKSSRFIEVSSTPGGTGAIRNAVANYSDSGDSLLTADWFWSPYKTICNELGRQLETYKLFDKDGRFNLGDFERRILMLLRRQENLCIILNTPAHNPTGYTIKEREWDSIVSILNKVAAKEAKRIVLFVDVAYIDFAKPEEAYVFLPKLENLNDRVLPLIGYSASKTFTMYGMRCGAIVCMAKDEKTTEEFVSAMEYSARGTWSNCNRSAQTIIEKIFNEEELLKRVDREREGCRKMLLRRGKVFEETALKLNLPIVPFDSGFFACISCNKPSFVSSLLEGEGVFAVPLEKGLRFSVASINEDKIVRSVKATAKIFQEKDV